MKLIMENWRKYLNEGEDDSFFKNMRAKQERCKGKPKTGDCAEDRPTPEEWDEITSENQESLEEETDKDRMKCNSPRYIKEGEPGYGKKQKVVKACQDGKEKIIRFGDANLEDRSDNPERKSNFRARHNCDDKKDKMTAGYWSCKEW